MTSVQSGTVVAGVPAASWWKNSGCSVTGRESYALCLLTTLIITRMPSAYACPTTRSKSAWVPYSGLTRTGARLRGSGCNPAPRRFGHEEAPGPGGGEGGRLFGLT